MDTTSLFQLLKMIFVEERYGRPNTDADHLAIQHGIRLTEINDPLSDLFADYKLGESGWLRPDDLACEIGFLSRENVPHWDVKIDGSRIMYYRGPMIVYFYQVEQLDSEEINKIKANKEKGDQEKILRAKAIEILKEELIFKMPSLNYLHTGYLEINHGIHLKQFKRGMHMNMPYKPNYGNVGWVVNKVLSWGSAIGWDVTLDGKIVCCRVNYDDYINFEVELLTEAEIEHYREKHVRSDKQMINRMATLKEMFDRQLITEDEYNSKKQEILSSI